MIIPNYWAEARLQHRERNRQVTVRRFGWSDESVEAAQAHAEARVREAFERVLAGEDLPRRERRIAYNGAQGVPIREEVVQREGDSVISRNGYGALCLNTPDVLFADIDFDSQPGPRTFWIVGLVLMVVVAMIPKFGFGSGLLTAFSFGVAAALLFGHALSRRLHAARLARQGGAERLAIERVRAFAAAHPQWRLRLYRTPAGLRLLALHRRFDPREPEVEATFKALGADTTYALMCRNQNCFRARVSPKPWRLGLQPLRAPYSAVWSPEHAQLPARRAWISEYQQAAAGFASCRYLETLGEGLIDPAAQSVQKLHDRLCQAERDLPLA